MIENLEICSPKRNNRLQTGWEGFFPYYAGYPEIFARALLESAGLKMGSVVLDPWNGSGTTTYAATQLGLTSLGFDLNPVMVIVARARLLASSEADSIAPLGANVVRYARVAPRSLDDSEPLAWWFAPETASLIRGIERSIRRRLLGDLTITPTGINIDRISGIAATFYVALFSVCRHLVARFQSTNPTWLRRPTKGEARVWASRAFVTERLLSNLHGMARALGERSQQTDLLRSDPGSWEIKLADTTSTMISPRIIDLVLTSPPYCTRIDYTAATRIELAVLAPLLDGSTEDLGRRMIGSIRVPDHEIAPSPKWGEACGKFLRALRRHPSKASKGYYYKTHLDYFNKMARSLCNLSIGMKKGSHAIFVVQDSFYKDLHNDLPTIITEMSAAHGLALDRREDFHLPRSMASINPRARAYRRTSGAVESVICFRKW